jgi:hypothetical protein
MVDAVLDHDPRGLRQRCLPTDHNGRRLHGLLHDYVKEVGPLPMLAQKFPAQALRGVEGFKIFTAFWGTIRTSYARSKSTKALWASLGMAARTAHLL